MIIYNSMIIWVAVMAAFYRIVYSGRQTSLSDDRPNRVPLLIAVLTFGYITFWVAIRSGVADTATYIQMYNNAPSTWSEAMKSLKSNSKAPGFSMLQILFKAVFHADYHWWLATIAVVTSIPIIQTLRKHSTNYMYSVFLFITTLEMTWMLNGIRQFLVAAVLFSMSDWILERKTGKVVIATLLLSMIHYTALIVLPFYWFINSRPFHKKMNLMLVLVVLGVVFLEPAIAMLENLLEGTAYSGATTQFAEDDGVNPLRVLAFTAPVILAFWCRKKIEQVNDPYINLCVNMSVITACLYFIGMFTSGILVGRLPIYFEMYNLILIPWLIQKCFAKNSVNLAYGLCSVCFLIYYYMLMSNAYYISDLTGLLS